MPNPTKSQTNDNNNLFTAIKSYVKATTNMAVIMAKIKTKHGRKVLEDITSFDVPRINILCGIGNLPMDLLQDLLPETLSELLGESETNQRKYVEQANKQQLKASQLRRIIRQNNRTVTTDEHKVKVNNFGKHLLLLQNQLKAMDQPTKQRALASLTNSILNFK